MHELEMCNNKAHKCVFVVRFRSHSFNQVLCIQQFETNYRKYEHLKVINSRACKLVEILHVPATTAIFRSRATQGFCFMAGPRKNAGDKIPRVRDMCSIKSVTSSLSEGRFDFSYPFSFFSSPKPPSHQAALLSFVIGLSRQDRRLIPKTKMRIGREILANTIGGNFALRQESLTILVQAFFPKRSHN